MLKSYLGYIGLSKIIIKIPPFFFSLILAWLPEILKLDMWLKI